MRRLSSKLGRGLAAATLSLSAVGSMTIATVIPAHAETVTVNDKSGDAAKNRDITSIDLQHTKQILKFTFYMKDLTPATKVTGVWSMCAKDCGKWRAIRLESIKGRVQYTMYDVNKRGAETKVMCSGGVRGAYGLKQSIAWFQVPAKCVGPSFPTRVMFGTTASPISNKKGADFTAKTAVKRG